MIHLRISILLPLLICLIPLASLASALATTPALAPTPTTPMPTLAPTPTTPTPAVPTALVGAAQSAPAAPAAPVAAATPTPAPATTTIATASPLNEASVVVTDRSPTALQLGLQAAYSEVMVKMSGNPNIMSVPLIRNASLNSTRWVQSYSYTEQGSGSSQQAPLVLNVVFNQTGMQQLLSAAIVPPQNNQNNKGQVLAPSDIKLLVTGVKNMNDFTLLMQTLRSQRSVSGVSVINIDPDRIALNVHLTGTVAQLQSELSTNNHFKTLVSTAETSANTNTTELFYLWVGQPT